MSFSSILVKYKDVTCYSVTFFQITGIPPLKIINFNINIIEMLHSFITISLIILEIWINCLFLPPNLKYMFNNINQENKTKLDLHERAETSTSGDIVLSCISTDKTVKNYTMEDIYHFSPEEQADYAAYTESKWSNDVTRALQEVMSWAMGEAYFSPSQQPDYEGEIERQIDLLRNLTPQTKNYDYTRIVNNGVYNVSMAGVFLGVLHPYPEQQKTATAILETIHWLVNQQNPVKGEPDSVGQITTIEDEDTIILRKQIECLNLSQCTTECYPLLYALKDAWHSLNKPWAADNSKFAEKIEPILNRPSSAIIKGLNRACALIRIEKGGIKCYPLTTLEPHQIDIPSKTQQSEEFEKWKERRSKISQVMSLDIAKTSDEENK